MPEVPSPAGDPKPAEEQPAPAPPGQPGAEPPRWDPLAGVSPLPPAGAPPPQAAFPAQSGGTPEAGRPSGSTTGLPHYSPPAGAPGMPWTPGVGLGAAPPARRRSLVRPLGRGLREIAETIVLALLIFLLVRSVVQNFQVEGRSMEPSLETGWYVLVNKALYWEVNLETVEKFVPFVDPGSDPTRYLFRGPRRGDIIVFESPTTPRGQPDRDFIKRVIGLPGETVEVRDCTVFIDGEALDEPYVADLPTYVFEAEEVPAGHYFVLGDNRNNSSDSHSWGMLPKENIIGQASLTYWPFSDFGLIDDTSVTPGDVLAEGEGPGKPAICPSSG